MWTPDDERAAAEGEAADWLGEINGFPPALLPNVRKGKELSYALYLHQLFPLDYDEPKAKNKGHFNTVDAIVAHERTSAGEIGKREIVTEADLTRRKLKAAARRLDVLEARCENPMLSEAMKLVRMMVA